MSLDKKPEILMGRRKHARNTCAAAETSEGVPGVGSTKAKREDCPPQPTLRDTKQQEDAETSPHETPALPDDGAHDVPHSHQELAQAIFACCNPVEVGRKLLAGDDPRTAPLRARLLETLADWLYGKSATVSSEGNDAAQMIWDLPGPSRERGEHEPS
jgi:hypothetical protein